MTTDYSSVGGVGVDTTRSSSGRSHRRWGSSILPAAINVYTPWGVHLASCHIITVSACLVYNMTQGIHLNWAWKENLLDSLAELPQLWHLQRFWLHKDWPLPGIFQYSSYTLSVYYQTNSTPVTL